MCHHFTLLFVLSPSPSHVSPTAHPMRPSSLISALRAPHRAWHALLSSRGVVAVDGRDARVDVDVHETIGCGAGDVAAEVRGAGDVGRPGGARASPRVVDDGASGVRAAARREHRQERREHERDARATAHRRWGDVRGSAIAPLGSE